jgi:hypothetical protein
MPRRDFTRSGVINQLFSFVPLRHGLHSPATRVARAVQQTSLKRQRAQGKPGAQQAPAASHANKKRTSVVATGSPKQSDLPCAMVYGLFRALPGDRAFLPPSLADRSASLTPASGRQDHTALPSAVGAFVSCAAASIASCTNVRDDREAPLLRVQDAGISAGDLPDGTSEIFLRGGLDDPNHVESLQ